MKYRPDQINTLYDTNSTMQLTERCAFQPQDHHNLSKATCRHIMVCQQTQLLYLQNEAVATRQACMDEAEKGVSCEAATRALEICLMVHIFLWPRCFIAIVCDGDAPRLTEVTCCLS